MTFKSLSLITATLLLTSHSYANETLEPITIVSANKTTQSIHNTTSNVTVITAEDIEENGYQTVAEAISHVSGISITNNGGLGKVTSIFLRGMKTEKVLVLLDGMSLNNPSSTDGQAFFEHISLDNIEQIEIIKGGASSIWGADASAGVINIITKKAKDGIHGNANITYGSYETKNITSSFSYKNDNFDAIVSASKLKNEGFSAKQPRSDEADGYDNTSANVKLGYRFNEKHQLGLNYNIIDADIEYDSFGGSNDPATSELKQKDISLNYTYAIDNYKSIFKIAQNKTDRMDSDNTSYYAKQNQISWINSLSSAGINYILGLEKKKTEGKYQSDWSANIENVFNDKAIFVSINHYLSGFEKTLIEGSIRKDFFDKFENQLSYKIGIKHFYQNIDGLTSSINYYKSTDAPNSYQVANTVFGNTLTPDTTKGYDISVHYKDIGLTYFSNTIKNRLGYDNDNWGYINYEGKEKTSGIEFDASHSFTDLNTIVSLNYSHLLNYEDDEGFTLEKRAKDTLNLSLNRYTGKYTQYGINAQYIGDRIEYYWNTHDIKAKTGNYTLWNLNFSTRIINDIDLIINARNIFDKEYETTYGYATEGRSLYAKIKYSF